ncbi:MAG: hypothetical protein CMC15_14500 [Flavobacteriaceae bacterium]|nr:hypothetical protein [Flavobacteriaceae bacterium]
MSQQLAATNRLLRQIRDNMQSAASAQREMEEAQAGLNNEMNKFTRIAEALANPTGKLAVFIKLGYATIPFFFKLKNQVELTSRAIGALIDKVKGGEGGLLVGAAKGMANQFKKAKEIATDISEMKFKSGILGAANFLSFGVGGALAKGAGATKGGIGKLIEFARADDKRKRMRRGAYKALIKFYAGADKVYGVLTKVPLKAILINIGAFVLFGLKIFIGLSLAIGVPLLFLKSEAFQNAFKAFMEVLRSLKEPLMAAFTLIKDGFMLIYNGLFGGGGFWSSLGMVLKGLGKILMGILKGLFTLAFGLLKAGLVAVGVAIRDAATYAVNAVINYLAEKARGLFSKKQPKYSKARQEALMEMYGAREYARGGITGSGLSIVGERGPELVKLPMGSRVFSNTNSRKMISNGGVNNITVNVQGRIGASDTELRQIASKIGGMINKEVNRTTSSRGTLG